eukprot:CAMPEP_0198207814 /NCGR_PEP_ID=MMETSP1445-20131203/11235_1 /TAXON_ID=36898 /ORGANISM="Pyramimonas sp., Strain CCMP2087" /LENGTH=49 /DNA_ID= /DNA_START= /DNA_END= /DNA_ORIENTATION=
MKLPPYVPPPQPPIAPKRLHILPTTHKPQGADYEATPHLWEVDGSCHSE